MPVVLESYRELFPRARDIRDDYAGKSLEIHDYGARLNVVEDGRRPS